ncbi:hypothetical protein [Stenotrophomonas oahuensis]|uniref:Uncharacterized protein n=1 Tax=Stenotrophomonas oahuensis TaxID=3003271 RepID=A0ABY9YP84_9GAMM|nr:hypothetical protein [Stenotrophomonas sp. A5586]WNH52440.1 hypothetical protein PDM29_19305 [Stenotrophomonas sp. A5586]
MIDKIIDVCYAITVIAFTVLISAIVAAAVIEWATQGAFSA